MSIRLIKIERSNPYYSCFRIFDLRKGKWINPGGGEQKKLPRNLNVSQANARNMVRHLIKYPFTLNWNNDKTICMFLEKFYTLKFI